MAYEADRVVVELIARIDKFDAPIKSSAQSFDQSMKQIEGSATRAEAAVSKASASRVQALQRESAQIGQFSKLLGSQLNDVGGLLSGPRSPFVVTAREAPKVTNALRLVQVGGGAMAGVLGGIAVTATTALVAALAELILKSESTEAKLKDLVDGLKEHADKSELSRKAAALFAETQEGVHDALLKAEDARKKAEDGLRSYGESANIAAKQNLKVIDSNIRAAESWLELAKAQTAAANATTFGAGGGASASAAQRFFSDQVKVIEDSIAKMKADRQGFEAELQASRADLAAEAGKRAVDPIARLNKQFDAEVEAAKKAAIATGKVTTELTKQIAAIERRREAALKEARDVARTRKASEVQQSGRQITEADARRIVAGIGGTVTSGTRSVQHNADVGGVPNSFHTKGQALDIAKTAGLTLTKIVRAFQAQGVALIEKLDEGDHFHIAWRNKSAEALAKAEDEAAKAAIREANRKQAFENEQAGLDNQVIDARQALVTSVEQIAALELQAIQVAHDKYADDLANQVQTKKLHEDEAKHLIERNDELAKLRAEAVKRRLAEQQARIREADMRRAAEVQGASIEAMRNLLESQEQLATTARERHDIERRIIDLQFAEERLRLENQIAIARQVQANKDGAFSAEQIKDAIADEAIARSQLGTLPQRQTNAQAGNDRANQTPLQSYFDSIPDTAAEINEAFESVVAGGLATFTDALTDAIVNFRSLGDVGRAVLQSITAQLVRMAIQQIILHTIGKGLQTAATGAVVAQMAVIGSAAAGPAALVSLATAGGNAIPAQAGIASTVGLATVLGAPKARGGRVRGPGSDTSDTILTPTSPDEFVIRAASARRIGYSTLEALNRDGVMPSNDQAAHRVISPMNVPAARPGGREGGISSADLQRFEGMLGRAIEAQPAVNLYPTMDPAAAMRSMLADPGARRVLFEFFGDNSGAMKATMNR